MVSFFVAWLAVLPAFCSAKDFKPTIDSSSKAELYELAHEIEVLAPSHFPKPTRKYNNSATVPVAEPTFGTHRPEEDVVMVSSCLGPVNFQYASDGERQTGNWTLECQKETRPS